MTREEAKNDLFQKISLGLMSNSTKISDFIDNIYDSCEELSSNTLRLKSCDDCIYKDKNGAMDYNCFECSRYYDDKFVKRRELK